MSDLVLMWWPSFPAESTSWETTLDHNDGMSLPMAIDRYTAIAMRRRDHGDIRVFSEFGSPVTFDPTSLVPASRGWGEPRMWGRVGS